MTAVDIDLYRKTEAALRERESELSQLVDMVPSHLWRLTPDGEPTYYNKRMVDFLGVGVADTLRPGMSRLDALIEIGVHPDDRASFKNAMRKSLATGSAFAMRYRLRRADGVYRWMSSRAEPMRDAEERIVQWYGLCHDIDDQMHAEETLRRSEQQLRQMIDAVPVRIWSAPPSGKPIYFNKRYQEHLRSVVAGFDSMKEPSIQQFMEELVHPQDISTVEGTLRCCFETGDGRSTKFRWLESDGGYRWAECRIEARRDSAGAVAEWYGVSLDIDDEVRAQDALRRREHQLKQLIDAVPALIWCMTPEGTLSYISKRYQDVVGVTLGDLIGLEGSLTYADVHPDDRAAVKQALAGAIRNGVSFSTTYRQRRSDGSYRWTEGRLEPLRDSDGVIIHWYGTNVDIHELLTSQENLRARERELSLLVDMVPALIGRMDPDGEPTFFSKRTADAIGLDRIDAFDKPGMSRHAAMVAARIHPDDGPGMIEIVGDALATGEPYTIKFRWLARDGSYRWMNGRAEPFRDESGAIVQWYTAFIDIDDEVRAQDALRRQQQEREEAQTRLQQLRADFAHAARVSVLGELTASIAHEVNQPLTAIAATSQASLNWLSRDAPDLDKVRKLTENVVADAERASEIIGRIRAMAMRRVPEQALLSIDDVIREALLFLHHEVESHRVAVSHLSASNGAMVLGDRTQLQQVVVNLAINAVQAIAQADCQKREIGIRTSLADQTTLTCSIEDSGPGLEPRHIARLFDSFFTTRHGGMGMGLRICRSILEAHGGRISADNGSVHGGARFSFVLPVIAADAR